MADILNLPGLRVVDIIEREHQYTVRAEVDDHQPPERCCLLGPVQTVRNGTKRVMYRDLRIHQKFVDIHIDRQRFKCKNCGKTLYETIPGMHPQRQMTQRLYDHLCKAPATKTFTSVAADVGMDEGTIRSVFDDHVTELLKDYSFETPRVLGIDEKHLLGGYRCVVGNVEERTLLDLISNRFKRSLSAYLDTLENKDRVEVVCQDMWDDYLKLAAHHFPKAIVVVDKFHVVKKANEGLEKFRRSMNASLDKRTRVKLKNQRKILLARYTKLEPQTREKLERWLEQFPALADAYWLKERFYDFYDCTSRAEAERVYQRWLGTMPKEMEEPFLDLTRCMRNWWPYIVSYFEHPYTNAYVEGINRFLDEMQRQGSGYSFEVMRPRHCSPRGITRRRCPPSSGSDSMAATPPCPRRRGTPSPRSISAWTSTACAGLSEAGTRSAGGMVSGTSKRSCRAAYQP